MAVKFSGAAKRLEAVDYPRIARTIGVGEDELRAVVEVEAAGSGFDAKGRLKMLFEPHVFYRNLSGDKRERAVREGLAYPRWRSGNYPKDSYPRLLQAMQIDETAALKAASWGLSQILGESCADAGYRTPQDMIADFVEDEDNHLEAMVRFIVKRKLDDDIRRHDWLGLALGYNGPRANEHGYPAKLKAAFAKYQARPDTPYAGDNDDEPEAPTPAPRPEPRPPHGAKSQKIRDVQSLLKKFGYHEVGEVDGKWGGRTRAAIAAYKNDRHLEGAVVADDELIEDMAAALAEDPPFTRPLAPERKDAPDEKVEEKVPAVKEGRLARWWAKVLTFLGLGGGGTIGLADFISDHSDDAANAWNKVNELTEKVGIDLSAIPWMWLLAFACVGGLIWWRLRRADQSLKDAYRDGEIP